MRRSIKVQNLCLWLFLTLIYASSLVCDNFSFYEGLGFGSSNDTNGTEYHHPSFYLTPEQLVAQVSLLTDLIAYQLNLTGNESIVIELANLTVHGIIDLSVVGQILSDTGDVLKTETICTALQVMMGTLLYQSRRPDSTPERVVEFVSQLCTTFKISIEEVCQGLAERIFPTFYFIVKEKPKLKASVISGFIGQSFGCRIPRKDFVKSEFDWKLKSLTRNHPHKNNKSLPKVSNEFRMPKIDEGKKILKILHLTDLHIDLDYKGGSNAVCDNDILCCQEKNGIPKENETGAGYFGDKRKCDLPEISLKLTLEHIQNTHGKEIDLIYMTGDLVPHSVWYTSLIGNTKVIQKVSKMIHEYFPTSIVIPCLGNHEVHPVNFYSPTDKENSVKIPKDLKTDWIYQVAYDSWKQWIPSDQRQSFLSSGHYAMEINPQFRVLVVNTNLCYVANFWQLYEVQDPGGQLQWLQQQLELTQSQNRTAHIVGHVPPGNDDCFKTWSKEFYKIISKYSKIVRGQFYGHTHVDEFKIFHNPQNKTEATNVLWIGPSITPYSINNAAYRIYHMELGFENTYGDIIDHETWIYDLEQANKNYLINNQNQTQLQWFLYYQATKAYNIKNILPSSLKQFVIKMAKDQEAFDLFYRYYHKSLDPNYQEKDPCDTLCKKKLLCGIVKPYYDDDDGQVECNTIQMQVDGKITALNYMSNIKKSLWM